MRGLAAAVTMALGLWIFRGPMPGMATSGTAMAEMAMAGGATPMALLAAVHAGGAGRSPAPGAGGGCALCIGCCPGSATPPPNPLGLRFDQAPAAVPAGAAPAPALPPRSVVLHWQPQPIGPPAPHVS